MDLRPRAPGSRADRRGRRLRPSLVRLEERVVPSLSGIAGIAFDTSDTSGDLFVSYDSTPRFSSQQQQSVALVTSNGFLVNSNVFSTTGASAFPGALITVGSSASLPSVSANEVLELQPNGQLFVYDPVGGTATQYDDLPNYSVDMSKVFDLQTAAPTNLTGQISLTGATYGDFAVYGDSIVVSAESNNWDFVLRVTYGSSGAVPTILVASQASGGLSASPGGIAVDSTGTVLTTLPYVPPHSSTAVDAPVGFDVSYDTDGSPKPAAETLGLASVPDIESSGIAVDSQNNFLLAAVNTSLFGGSGGSVTAGIVHINSALNAFLAVPNTGVIPAGITYQNVSGTDELAFTDQASGLFTLATELSLFSGQASPAQLRHAYGVDQISFTGPGGTTVTGDGTGQTIAIVENAIDPTLGADLKTFDQFFGIPAPPSFQVINATGATTSSDVIAEASLDVEWAHAIAPGASIIVYNAASASVADVMAAMQAASTQQGVTVVTLSYGLGETAIAAAQEKSLDSDFTTPGVTFLAASGDSGDVGSGTHTIGVSYPAASPNVVSVGGTSIVFDTAGDYPGNDTTGEVAWSDSGGGLSGGALGPAVESEPAWQSGVVPASIDSDGARAVPDVAMDSGSAQEYDVFTSTLSANSSTSTTSTGEAVGWLGDAGTSAAAPIWAGLIAIADQGRALGGGTALTGYTQTLPALYSLPAADFHDIVSGNNGYPALPGYDLTTGLGTPVANSLVKDLAGYQIASRLAIQTEPQSTVVAGNPFGLSVQVDDSLGNPASGGTVTIALANDPGGAILEGVHTATVVNGVATFSNLAISQPGTGFTLTATASGSADTLTTTPITVTAASHAATLGLSNLNFTYDGSSHAPSVTTSPGGLPGVTVTYTQSGVAVANPTHAGDYTVTATLDNPDYTAPVATGTLVIGQATPLLTWANPANITVGTPLGATQLDATASFAGMPLPGVLSYTTPAGTMLATGNGQTLSVSFTPADDIDFKTVTASVAINVVPQTPPPAHAMVISRQPVFRQKLNKKGKPVGKAVLTGFTLEFNMPLAEAAMSNPKDYELDTTTINKRGGRVFHQIKNFSVAYTPGSDSVTLELRGVQTFPTGGRIKVLPAVTLGSGSVLTGSTVFTITPGGKKVKPS